MFVRLTSGIHLMSLTNTSNEPIPLKCINTLWKLAIGHYVNDVEPLPL